MSDSHIHRRFFVQALVGIGVCGALQPPAVAEVVETESHDSPITVLKQQFVGKATQVLVLGTPHLSAAPKIFTSSMLEPLLSRLQHFAPDVICIEALSGASIAALQAYPRTYADSLDEFGGVVLKFETMGRAGTGLDPAAAEQSVDRLLGGGVRTPADNRHLIACLASAGDSYSALLQWWRLPKQERISADGITAALAQALEALGKGRNEIQYIAVTLAARLGHDRVWPIDDHSADDLLDPIAEALGAYLSTPGVVDAAKFSQISGVAQALTSSEAVLPTYRKVNSAKYARSDAETEWKLFIDKPTPKDMGRVRIAEWEIRNLRQVANIRKATASAPGGRVLVIVGADHKAWFDGYLNLMSDLTIVDAQVVLA